MSKRGKKYSADFKTKVVLELLEGDQTLNQGCSKYEVTPKLLKDQKATFLANASLAFNVESAVSGYKKALALLQAIDDIYMDIVKYTSN